MQLQCSNGKTAATGLQLHGYTHKAAATKRHQHIYNGKADTAHIPQQSCNYRTTTR